MMQANAGVRQLITRRAQTGRRVVVGGRDLEEAVGRYPHGVVGGPGAYGRGAPGSAGEGSTRTLVEDGHQEIDPSPQASRDAG